MHRDIKALILQVSQGGCAFFAGKGLPNDNQQASIIGLIDGAHHILAVATSYNVSAVLHNDHCAKKLVP
ncbi:hypothetical protein SCLCIDRAFT_126930 [Scleroderma citrinum Foug A]|uniref:Uncharacterized protein n=1 Tax=Scleroderma citrinum Foug A TaxID=1036808 RepID=A0A0C3DSA9_9AGAM|nr:hypothetical protein SCLCIDRAFT_126930 [Scleroderma citrinum Foug A]